MTIWARDTMPVDWTKGVNVQLPKKGDLQNAKTLRGITLVSVPWKVFCRVPQMRIKEFY